MSSLREAIVDADEIKEKTGKKAIVVFNNHGGTFEAMSKRLLKKAAKNGKAKGSPALTKARKKRKLIKTAAPGRFTSSRIKNLEKKSLYVTK